MLKSLLSSLLLLFTCSMLAQPVYKGATPVTTIESIPQLTLDGSYYPEFLLGEKFYNYRIDYRISDKLMLEIQSFYSRFGIKERLRMPVLLKARITKNMFFLAGPEVEYDLSDEVQRRKPRISMNTGIEYRREDSFYINAMYNYQLNDSNVGPQGNIGGSNIINVSSGLKF